MTAINAKSPRRAARPKREARLAVLGLCIFSTGLHAQPAERITETPQVNAFIAEYTVLEDYPSCNAAGEVAYELRENLLDLNYRLTDVNTRQEQYVAAFEPTRCTRRERRGVDVVVIEVPCRDGAATAQSQPFTTSPPSLNLDVTLVQCISPVRNELMHIGWTAQLQSTPETLFESSGGGVKRVPAWPPPTFDNPTLIVDEPQTNSQQRLWHNRGSPRQETAFDSAYYVRAQAVCLPVGDAINGGDLVLDTEFVLFINDGRLDVCTGEGCPMFEEFRYQSRADRCRNAGSPDD